MPFLRPKRGSPYYRCPWCRRGHRRNSTIGHLHKVYIDLDRGTQRAGAAPSG